MGPLEGLRIIDMSTVLMGPYATQILGDFGADVVKVESPEGDVTRQSRPSRSPRSRHRSGLQCRAASSGDQHHQPRRELPTHQGDEADQRQRKVVGSADRAGPERVVKRSTKNADHGSVCPRHRRPHAGTGAQHAPERKHADKQ